MGKHAARGSVWAWPKRVVIGISAIGIAGSSIGIVVARVERDHAQALERPQATTSAEPSPSPSPQPSVSPEPALPPPPPADALNPSRGPLATVYSSIRTRNNVVFITIDDGWFVDDRVADLLERTHIPVTLFLVQTAAHEHLSFFKRLVAAGATVEDHTVDHHQLTKLGYAAQQHEICGGADGLAGMFGRRPTLFRPPFGSFNQSTRVAVRACGLSALLTWSASMNFGYIAVQDKNLSAGELILMHFRPDLYDNLTNLLKELARRHLTVGRLEDYIPTLPAATPAPAPTPTPTPTPTPSPSPST